MNKHKIFLIMLWLLLISTIGSHSPDEMPSFNFIDEAKENPSFCAFRKQLIRALEKSDTTFVLSVFDKDVKLDFGGGYGIDELKNRFREPVHYGDLWNELHTLLLLGGTFSGDEYFIAPYVYSEWPDGIDAYTHIAVTGNRIPVYKQPESESEKLTFLSYTIVEKDFQWYDTDWVRIKLPNGKSGFIMRIHTRSPIDYRIIFRQTDTVWEITVFLAGD